MTGTSRPGVAGLGGRWRNYSAVGAIVVGAAVGLMPPPDAATAQVAAGQRGAANSSSASPAPPAGPAPRAYVPAGTGVTGGAEENSAPTIVPGRYRDTFPAAGRSAADATVKYYRFSVAAGQTPRLLATLVPPAPDVRPSGQSERLAIKLYTLGSGQCSITDDASVYTRAGKVDAVRAVLDAGPAGGTDWPSGCPASGEFVLELSRSGGLYPGRDLVVEIVLRLEPPVLASGPAAATAQLNVAVTPTAQTSPTRGGTGFSDAPRLMSASYRDTAVSGETVYYRVRLAWGQRLAYRIRPSVVPGFDGSGLSATVELVNPLRQPVAQSKGSTDSVYSLGRSEDSMAGSTPAPVRYANRTSTDSDVAHCEVDGDYYLVLSTARPSADLGAPTIAVPFTLTTTAVGSPEPGPTYRAVSAADAAGTSADPAAGPGPRTRALLGAGAGAVVATVVLLGLARLRRR